MANVTIGTHEATWPSLQRRGGQVIISMLRTRLEKQVGTIVLIIGPPGTGKSFTAMFLASQLDPTFTIDRVVFDVIHYLDFLGGGTVAGQAVILDEAGVSAPSRKWQSQTNIALSLTVESVRHRGLLTIVTVPDASMIDINVRKLAFLVINTRKIDLKTDEVIGRPYLVRTNYVTGEVYMRNPTTILTNKAGYQEPVKWASARFGRPPHDLEVAYLAKRLSTMDALYKSLSASLKDDAIAATPGGDFGMWVCRKCGHQWRARVKSPPKCARNACNSNDIYKE